MSKKTKGNVITTDDALSILEEAKQKRVNAVSADIQATLEKNNCDIDISVTLSRGQVTPQIRIIAKD